MYFLTFPFHPVVAVCKYIPVCILFAEGIGIVGIVLWHKALASLLAGRKEIIAAELYIVRIAFQRLCVLPCYSISKIDQLSQEDVCIFLGIMQTDTIASKSNTNLDTNRYPR